MSNIIDGKIKKCVKVFVNELQNKITDLTALREQNKELSLNYDRVCGIISKYVMGPSSGLTKGDVILEDIIKFNPKDLEEILNLIGVNDKSIILEFEEKRNTYFNTRNETKKKELSSFFQRILDYIDRYVEEYNIRSRNQLDFEASKIEKYQKFIEIFSREEFLTLFDEEELKELKLLMSECSLDAMTKAEILKYVNIQNITFTLKETKKVQQCDLKSHVYYLVKNYLDDERYVNICRREMPSIDFETIVSIKDIASSIASNYNLDQAKTINTLVAIAINSMYIQYENYLESDEQESSLDIEALKQSIRLLENCFVDSDKVTVEIATNLVVENENMIKEYESISDKVLDQTIQDLSQTYTKEEAVFLKTLPILIGIRDTLETLAKHKNEEDIKQWISYLSELIEMYNETKILSENKIRDYRNK